MIKQYYVYRHIRLDTNIPFYVGKGVKNRVKSNRFPEWKRSYE